MQPHHFIDKADQESELLDVKQPLQVVIAYADLASGKRAMRIISDLGKGLGDDLEFELAPWSFELLMDMDWGQVATRDAVSADMLIFATNFGPLPPAVARWAEMVISRKRGMSAAVVALFSQEDDLAEVSSSQLEAIQTAAHRAGLDFFAPAPNQELARAVPGIHPSSAMAEDILRHQHPASRWGINE